MHHLQRFAVSDASASTQSVYCDSLIITIALSLLKQCLIWSQSFGSLFSNVDMKVTSVEQEAASAVASVDI